MIIQRKLFARHDYEGLDDVQKEVLRKKRSEYAKALNKSRNSVNIKGVKDALDKNDWSTLNTHGNIKGGGVESRFNVTDFTGPTEIDNNTFAKRHVRNVRNSQLTSADSASKMMRDQVLNDFEGEVSEARKLKKDTGLVKNSKGEVKNVGKEKLSKSAKGFLKKYKKPLLIGGGVAALGGAGIYGYKKYKDNKKEG